MSAGVGENLVLGCDRASVTKTFISLRAFFIDFKLSLQLNSTAFLYLLILIF